VGTAPPSSVITTVRPTGRKPLALTVEVDADAKAMGVSRQCAHRWVSRFDAEGEQGGPATDPAPHDDDLHEAASVTIETPRHVATVRAAFD
jgi:hypothetical protein